MSKGKAELFTGGKSVRLEDLPEEAWRVIAGEGGGQGEAAKLYAVVSWLYRCIDIRAGAVANMPWEIKRVGASGDASAAVSYTHLDVYKRQGRGDGRAAEGYTDADGFISRRMARGGVVAGGAGDVSVSGVYAGDRVVTAVRNG